MPGRKIFTSGPHGEALFTFLRHWLQADHWPQALAADSVLLDSSTQPNTSYAAMNAETAQPAVEKRATRRFAFRLRIAIKLGEQSGDLNSCTRDVSARGVSFYADRPLAEGTGIQFTLTLPPEVTLTESISMRCAGRVVRVDPSDTGRGVSIAAVIDRYEFLGDS